MAKRTVANVSAPQDAGLAKMMADSALAGTAPSRSAEETEPVDTAPVSPGAPEDPAQPAATPETAESRKKAGEKPLTEEEMKKIDALPWKDMLKEWGFSKNRLLEYNTPTEVRSFLYGDRFVTLYLNPSLGHMANTSGFAPYSVKVDQWPNEEKGINWRYQMQRCTEEYKKYEDGSVRRRQNSRGDLDYDSVPFYKKVDKEAIPRWRGRILSPEEWENMRIGGYLGHIENDVRIFSNKLSSEDISAFLKDFPKDKLEGKTKNTDFSVIYSYSVYKNGKVTKTFPARDFKEWLEGLGQEKLSKLLSDPAYYIVEDKTTTVKELVGLNPLTGNLVKTEVYRARNAMYNFLKFGDGSIELTVPNSAVRDSAWKFSVSKDMVDKMLQGVPVVAKSDSKEILLRFDVFRNNIYPCANIEAVRRHEVAEEKAFKEYLNGRSAAREQSSGLGRTRS